MPGQPGSENRQRQIVRSTRWSETEFALLQRLAAFAGCSEAELLRRLVNRAGGSILLTRALITEVNKVGVNLNQIARQMNRGLPVEGEQFLDAYRELLRLVEIAKR